MSAKLPRITLRNGRGEVVQSRDYSCPMFAVAEYARQLDANRTIPIRADWSVELTGVGP